MDDLIIRSLQGCATPEEVELLYRWRMEDPEHDRHHRRLEELWAVLDVGAPNSYAGPLPNRVSKLV